MKKYDTKKLGILGWDRTGPLANPLKIFKCRAAINMDDWRNFRCTWNLFWLVWNGILKDVPSDTFKFCVVYKNWFEHKYNSWKLQTSQWGSTVYIYSFSKNKCLVLEPLFRIRSWLESHDIYNGLRCSRKIILKFWEKQNLVSQGLMKCIFILFLV